MSSLGGSVGTVMSSLSRRSTTTAAAAAMTAAAGPSCNRWGARVEPSRRFGAVAPRSGTLFTPIRCLATSTPVSSTPAEAAAAAAAAGATRCPLCDVPFTTWAEHSRLPAHAARVAICRRFVVVERSQAILEHIDKHVALDLRAVDEVTVAKERRRQGRLASTLAHLADDGVLLHSLPTASADGGAGAGLDVTERFLNFAVNGEGYARRETVDRVARLMPATGAADLAAVAAFVLSPRNLARLFDALHLSDALSRRAVCGGGGGGGGEPAPAAAAAAPAIRRQDEKALVLLACIGELAHLQRQDRSHSVADRAAADVLVRHVLATHAVENVLSELVHGVLQRAVADGTPLWAGYTEWARTVAAAAAASAAQPSEENALRPPRLPLAAAPQTAPPAATDAAAALPVQHAQLMAFLPVERIGVGSTALGSKKERLAPAVGAAPSYSHVAWGPTARSLPLATAPDTLPESTAAHPRATYAPVAPRLVARKRVQ